MPRAPKVKLPRTVSIRGKRWRIVRWHEDAEPDRHWGECYIDDQIIWIHPDICGKQLVDTLIHELHHACDGRAPENRVYAHGEASARYLKRAGLI